MSEQEISIFKMILETNPPYLAVHICVSG